MIPYGKIVFWAGLALLILVFILLGQKALAGLIGAGVAAETARRTRKAKTVVREQRARASAQPAEDALADAEVSEEAERASEAAQEAPLTPDPETGDPTQEARKWLY